MNKLVSVIIPISHEETQAHRCIESILTQTYPELEIILVEYGLRSTGSELCEAYASRDSRVKVIPLVGGSPSEAKNAGLDAITGEYVYFLEGMDYAVNTLIEAALGNAVATSADMVLFHYNKIDALDNLLSTVRFEAGSYDIEDQNRIDFMMKELLRSRAGWELGNRLLKTELIKGKKLSFWEHPSIRSEDRGFILSYALHVKRVTYLPEMLYYYRLQKGSKREQSPKEPMLSEAVELCKLLNHQITAAYELSAALKKKYPLLLFGLINEQLVKLNSYNYRKVLTSIEDQSYFNRLLRRMLRHPVLLIRYYGIAKGMALLLQCAFLSSGREKRVGIFVLHMMNKLLIISEVYQYNKLRLGSKKRIFLIGCEDFWNLGDHHIAISELEYLEKTFPDFAIIEITASQYFAVNRLLPFVIRRREVICMHGGGNIGNFYMLAEHIRRDLMKRFRNNEKVIFPQSIHYDTSDCARAELEEDQRRIRRTRNLTLCTREHYSYKLAKQYFDCHVVLTPDIVLFSNYTEVFKFERRGAILLLRNDLEGVFSEEDKQGIERVVQQYTSDIRRNDTQLICDINIYDRKEVLEEFLRKIAEAEFVITDRLHGMVFCAITKTPCIVLPNYNHKVGGVYEWISNLEYIKMIKDMGELEEALRRIRREQEPLYDNSILSEGFGVLTQLLKSKVK